MTTTINRNTVQLVLQGAKGRCTVKSCVVGNDWMPDNESMTVALNISVAKLVRYNMPVTYNSKLIDCYVVKGSNRTLVDSTHMQVGCK